MEFLGFVGEVFATVSTFVTRETKSMIYGMIKYRNSSAGPLKSTTGASDGMNTHLYSPGQSWATRHVTKACKFNVIFTAVAFS